jgi:putative secretion ATPase (PEP-CTERM system associated)
MYERFYGLRERPFSLTPDPSYLYPSSVHKEALNHLRYGIEGQAGFIVITGEIGCGKTTMLQTVLRALDKKTSIARLMNTMLDARELLEAIMLDFGLEPNHNSSKPYLLRDLARFLVDQRNAGRLSLLVIDEAQNLSIQALEEVRMLSNLETEKSKLIHIVLVGQPNLRDLLARPDLEQLRQRVTVSYHLEPLKADDTYAYINHRLKHASVGPPLTFPRAVTDIVHTHSRGVARMINVIADAILLYGYGADKHVIDAELANEVVVELGLAEGQPLQIDDDATPDPPAPVAPTVTMPPAVSPGRAAAPPLAMSKVEGRAPSNVEGLAMSEPARTQPRIERATSRSTPMLAPVRRTTPAPNHYVLFGPEPAPKSALAAWWERFRRSAFGIPRPAPES